jgi:hypothetical protein
MVQKLQWVSVRQGCEGWEGRWKERHDNLTLAGLGDWSDERGGHHDFFWERRHGETLLSWLRRETGDLW